MTSSLPEILREPHAYKPHHVLGFVRSLLHLHENPSFLGDPSNGAEVIARQLDAQHGSVPAQRIGTYGHRQQVKAGFIDKDYRAVFLLGFFFRCGQCCTFQRWVACSLRWVARCTGFCIL